VRPHNIKRYSFISAAQIGKLAEMQAQIHGTGLHVFATGECGCLKVFHPLLQDQIPITIDQNGNEINERI
jgi:hypothetical protein